MSGWNVIKNVGSQRFIDEYERKAYLYTQLLKEGIVEDGNGIGPMSRQMLGTEKYRELCVTLANLYDQYIAQPTEKKNLITNSKNLIFDEWSFERLDGMSVVPNAYIEPEGEFSAFRAEKATYGLGGGTWFKKLNTPLPAGIYTISFKYNTEINSVPNPSTYSPNLKVGLSRVPPFNDPPNSIKKIVINGEEITNIPNPGAAISYNITQPQGDMSITFEFKSDQLFNIVSFGMGYFNGADGSGAIDAYKFMLNEGEAPLPWEPNNND